MADAGDQGPHHDQRRHHRYDARPQAPVSRVSPGPEPNTQRKHSQRLEAGDPELGREQPGEEREHGGARLADARDVAEAPGEQPAREDAGGVVHQDGVHGPEQEPDERDRDRVLEERGDDPDGHFQPVIGRDKGREGVSMNGAEKERRGTRTGLRGERR